MSASNKMISLLIAICVFAAMFSANTVMAGTANWALQFNGTTFTVEAWVKPYNVTGSSTYGKSIVDHPGANLYVMSTDFSNLGFTVCVTGPGNPCRPIYAGSALVANEWQHLAATYDGTYMRIYRIGNLLSSGVHDVGGDMLYRWP